MIDRQTFFVYGLTLDDAKRHADSSLVVAAFSNRYASNELTDFTHVAHAGTHYGLNLPEGQYDLLVLADRDGSGSFDQSEVVGRRQIEVSVATHPEKVVDAVDISLSDQEPASWTIDIPVPEVARAEESLFYPRGTIRSLSDPLFDSSMASLGIFEPGAFLERAPTMFYALEEDSYKIPVVFVHGIGGSARDFASIVDRLDRRRFKPWFFFYPSGRDLDQLAEVFYGIFLSGKTVLLGETPMVIVAHSMGGLVAREALNRHRGTEQENRVELLITIASPLGGHPAAATGEKHGPLVLPSWRDLNPESRFIKRLFRKSLPSHLAHHLLFAYGNPEKLKLGENSDGVVPLSSQLPAVAQDQSTEQIGFNCSHTGVLQDEEAIGQILASVHRVGSAYPESHLEALIAGGFDVDLDSRYSDKEKHFIRTIGVYLSLLANGTLSPMGAPVLERFVKVSRGEAEPRSDPELAWSKFVEDYPHLVSKREN